MKEFRKINEPVFKKQQIIFDRHWSKILLLLIKSLNYSQIKNLENQKNPDIFIDIDGEITCMGIMYIFTKFENKSYDFKFYIAKQQDLRTITTRSLSNNILQTTTNIKNSLKNIHFNKLGIEIPGIKEDSIKFEKIKVKISLHQK